MTPPSGRCRRPGCLLHDTAHAEFAIPGFELVHTVPRETTLATPDLRDAALVWKEMFDSARREIVLANSMWPARMARRSTTSWPIWTPPDGAA
jgi:hypothetical protein